MSVLKRCPNCNGRGTVRNLISSTGKRIMCCNCLGIGFVRVYGSIYPPLHPFTERELSRIHKNTGL